MSELGTERRALAQALRGLGLQVIRFEDLGGREDSAQTAYLDGVARSDVYVGLVADRYGTMLTSGRSPTHEEYREARRRGLYIAVWVAADGSARQGNARDFVAEVQTFHTTGSWQNTEDLVASVVGRLKEIAAEAESPWVKLGEVVFRADSIEDDGRTLVIEMRSRDQQVIGALEALRPDSWGRIPDLTVTTAHRSGRARITNIASRTSSAQHRALAVSADVQWADGRRPSMATGLNGIPVEDQVEIGLRAGLFREPLPPQLGMLATMIDTADPLSALEGLNLPQATYESVARLLLVERLLGGHGASRVDHFAVGPESGGRRPVELAWREAFAFTGVEPPAREIAGDYRGRGAA